LTDETVAPRTVLPAGPASGGSDVDIRGPGGGDCARRLQDFSESVPVISKSAYIERIV
jgi:hypothetical protein